MLGQITEDLASVFILGTGTNRHSQGKILAPRTGTVGTPTIFTTLRRIEALETEIPALEAEKAALEASLSSGTLPVEELTAQSRRIAELIASIDEKTMRWLELSER